jgi:glycyl-tRNA synthetase beta chain
VPDLVEYPAVVAGHFPVEFLQLPEEVLTTTMIHHQHYFPVVDDEGRLKPAFLAVTNMQPEKPEIIARNSERVLTARLRDARFFWDDDRKTALASRVDRLDTILFHKKLGSYRQKADRVASLAAWIAAEALQRTDAAPHAELAGRLSKADLATDMVRELTELQGTMGGIYAREEGKREEVWKAIYYHYLPVGVEADAPPSRQQLGAAAVTWAAVSLADKLDSVVGMFTAGERPTGSRDPLGLRRQAHGVVKILADLPELTGIDARLRIGPLLARAAEPFGGYGDSPAPLFSFIADRLAYLLEQRGFDVRNVRAVTSGSAADLSPLQARRKLDVLPEFTESADFKQLAMLFKRVRNIARNLDPAQAANGPADASILVEPAEVALLSAIEAREPAIAAAVASGQGFRQAFSEAARLGPAVGKFFDDVLVMAEDQRLREARLRLMKRLETLLLQLADVSEIVPES